MQKLRNRNDKRPKMVSSWRVDPEVRCAAFLFFLCYYILYRIVSFCWFIIACILNFMCVNQPYWTISCIFLTIDNESSLLTKVANEHLEATDIHHLAYLGQIRNTCDNEILSFELARIFACCCGCVYSFVYVWKYVLLCWPYFPSQTPTFTRRQLRMSSKIKTVSDECYFHQKASIG